MTDTFLVTGQILDKAEQPVKRARLQLASNTKVVADGDSDILYAPPPRVTTDDDGYLCIDIDGKQTPADTPGVPLIVGVQYRLKSSNPALLNTLVFSDDQATDGELDLSDVVPENPSPDATWTTALADLTARVDHAVYFGATAPDPEEIPVWADTSTSPATMKGWNGSAWVAISGGTGGTLDADLTDIADATPANDDVMQRKGGHWTNRTIAQLKTDLAYGTAASKNTGAASGDVPLLSTGGVLPIARLATGTPDGTKFVRDDGTLATPTALYAEDETLSSVTALEGGGWETFGYEYPTAGYGGESLAANVYTPLLLDPEDYDRDQMMFLPGWGINVRDNALTAPIATPMLGNDGGGAAQIRVFEFHGVTSDWDPQGLTESSQYLFNIPNQCWGYIKETGELEVRFRDSAGAIMPAATSTDTITPRTELDLKVVIDPANTDAGGVYTVDFLTADLGGTYQSFGSQVVGATAITGWKTTLTAQNGDPLTPVVTLGENPVGSNSGSVFRGGFLGFKLRIGSQVATPLLDLRAEDWTPSAATTVDSAGVTWTINNLHAANWVTEPALASAPGEYVTVTGTPDVQMAVGPGLFPTLTGTGFSWDGGFLSAKTNYRASNSLVNLAATPTTQSVRGTVTSEGRFRFLNAVGIDLGLARMATEPFASNAAATARNDAISAAGKDARAGRDELLGSITGGVPFTSTENITDADERRLYDSARWDTTAYVAAMGGNYGLAPLGIGDGSEADHRRLLGEADGPVAAAATATAAGLTGEGGITGGAGGSVRMVTNTSDDATGSIAGSWRYHIRQATEAWEADPTAASIITFDPELNDPTYAHPIGGWLRITLDAAPLEYNLRNITIDGAAILKGVQLDGGGNPGPVPYGTTSGSTAVVPGGPTVLTCTNSTDFQKAYLRVGNQVDVGAYVSNVWTLYGTALTVTAYDATAATITVSGGLSTTAPSGSKVVLSGHEPGVKGCQQYIGGATYNSMFGPAGYMTGSAAAINVVTGGNLVLSIDGGDPITVAIATSDTPTTAVGKINTALTGYATASLVSSVVKITSATAGALSSRVRVVSSTGTVASNLKLVGVDTKLNIPAGNMIWRNIGIISNWGGDQIDTGNANDLKIRYWADTIWFHHFEMANPDPFHDSMLQIGNGVRDIWFTNSTLRDHYKALMFFGGNVGSGGYSPDSTFSSTHPFPPGYTAEEPGPYTYVQTRDSHGNPTGDPVVIITGGFMGCDFNHLGQRGPKNDHGSEMHIVNNWLRNWGLPANHPYINKTTYFPPDGDDVIQAPQPVITNDVAKTLAEWNIATPDPNADMTKSVRSVFKYTGTGGGSRGYQVIRNNWFEAPPGGDVVATSEGTSDPDGLVPDFSQRYSISIITDKETLRNRIDHGAGIGKRSQMWEYVGPASVQGTVVTQQDGVDIGAGATEAPAGIIDFAGAGFNAPTYDSGTRTTVVTVPAGANMPDASTTVKGKVELATTGETTTGTDTVRAVTPAGVAAALAAYGGAADATDTVKGIVELATTSEATTGTDTVRAVTPAGVAAALTAAAALPRPGQVIGEVSYAPNSAQTAATIASSTMADVSASGVTAAWSSFTASTLDVTFVVPASRLVAIEVEALVKGSAAGTQNRFQIVDPTGAVTFGANFVSSMSIGTANIRGRYIRRVDFSALSVAAGASVTVRPQWAASTGTSTIDTGGNFGPVRVTVYAR